MNSLVVHLAMGHAADPAGPEMHHPHTSFTEGGNHGFTIPVGSTEVANVGAGGGIAQLELAAEAFLEPRHQGLHPPVILSNGHAVMIQGIKGTRREDACLSHTSAPAFPDFACAPDEIRRTAKSRTHRRTE